MNSFFWNHGGTTGTISGTTSTNCKMNEIIKERSIPLPLYYNINKGRGRHVGLPSFRILRGATASSQLPPPHRGSTQHAACRSSLCCASPRLSAPGRAWSGLAASLRASPRPRLAAPRSASLLPFPLVLSFPPFRINFFFSKNSLEMSPIRNK